MNNKKTITNVGTEKQADRQTDRLKGFIKQTKNPNNMKLITKKQ